MKKLLARQLAAFHQLSHSAKRLLASSLSYNIADLLSFTFAHAYLFTQTDSFYSVIFFNLGFYIMLPIMFFANALLLRRFSVKTLFGVGLVGQGLVMSSLVFIPSLTMPIIFIFGLVFGIPMGLYWANRNFLQVSEVPDNQRNFFSGIDSSFSEIMSVFVPFVAGWFIALSAQFGWLPKSVAYQFIMLLGALFFTLSALSLRKTHVTTPIIHSVSLRRVSKDWQVMRWFIFFAGIQLAINSILPEMFILRYVGDEGTLGTLKAIFSIVVAVGLYWIGKRAKVSDRYRILFLSVAPLILGATMLLISFSAVTVTIFLLLQAVAGGFLFLVYFPVLAQVVERQDNGSIAHNYRYIVDHEVIINLGRIFIVIIMLLMMRTLPVDVAMTISVVLVAISQIGMLVAAKKLLVSPKGMMSS